MSPQKVRNGQDPKQTKNSKLELRYHSWTSLSRLTQTKAQPPKNPSCKTEEEKKMGGLFAMAENNVWEN